MELFEEKKARLIYQQNLTLSNIVNREYDKGEDKEFKQQYNCKLNGKFQEMCHGMKVDDFNNNSNHINNNFGEEMKIILYKKGDKKSKKIIQDKEINKFNFDICYGCRNCYIAGINMKVRIEYNEKTNKNKNRKMKENKIILNRRLNRDIKFECFVCDLITVFKGTLKQPYETRNELDEKAEQEKRGESNHSPLNTLPMLKTNNQNDVNDKDKKSKTKKNKKKRKNQNGLSELLANKRKREETEAVQTNSINSLNFFT